MKWNKLVKITFLSYVNTLFWCTLECVPSDTVLSGHPVLRGRFMQTWNVWKYQSAEMQCWNCWPVFPIEAFSIFLVKFLNRMSLEDSTGRKRLKPRGKLMTRSPFSPRPRSQFHHSSPSHFPSLIFNRCSRVPGMRAHDWILPAKMNNTKNYAILD